MWLWIFVTGLLRPLSHRILRKSQDEVFGHMDLDWWIFRLFWRTLEDVYPFLKPSLARFLFLWKLISLIPIEIMELWFVCVWVFFTRQRFFKDIWNFWINSLFTCVFYSSLQLLFNAFMELKKSFNTKLITKWVILNLKLLWINSHQWP